MVAAVTDAYATAAEYRAAVDKSDNTEDAVLLSMLGGVSRLIDRQCGGPMGPRFFTKDAAVVVRLFDGSGLRRLYVNDIATATGLVVKVDLDADYSFTGASETLTVNTHFLLGPRNADKGAEPAPFTRLDIRPGNAVLSKWPEQMNAIQVTAKYGWPAVPQAVKDSTISLVRQLRDLQEAGFTLTLQNLEASIRQSPLAVTIMRDVVREYGRQGVFV